MNFRMVSYADNYEDVLLQRAFGMDKRGFYIDVGAYAPVEHSVTKHFYDLGWRGINVEPNPAPYAALRDARDRDINLNIGLSDHDGELKILEAPGACWSVDKNLLTGYFGASEADIIEHTIPVKTLAEVCDRHVPAGVVIDFLKIDVEGHEHAVIAGGDWARHRPRLVLAEAQGFEAWEHILTAAGYHFALFEGVNRLYVRDEDKHLLPHLNYPVNVTDAFLIHGYMHQIHSLRAQAEQHEATVAHLSAQLTHATAQLAETSARLAELQGRPAPTIPAPTFAPPAPAVPVGRRLNLAARHYLKKSRLARRIVHRIRQGA